MTVSNTTPTVWIAGQDPRHVKSFQERIASFSSGHALDESDLVRSPMRVIHDVASHATAWLVVTHPDRWSPAMSALSAQCREANPGFRCLVLMPSEGLGDAERAMWPEDTIFLPLNSLSTTIIDRLRSETHAGRIANHRRRQIERLRQRSA